MQALRWRARTWATATWAILGRARAHLSAAKALPRSGGEVTRSRALQGWKCALGLACGRRRNGGEPPLGRAVRSGGLCDRLFKG